MRFPVFRDFFFFVFRALDDAVFPLDEFFIGLSSKVRLDPFSKFDGITPQILMAGETMRRSVA